MCFHGRRNSLVATDSGTIAVESVARVLSAWVSDGNMEFADIENYQNPSRNPCSRRHGNLCRANESFVQQFPYHALYAAMGLAAFGDATHQQKYMNKILYKNQSS